MTDEPIFIPGIQYSTPEGIERLALDGANALSVHYRRGLLIHQGEVTTRNRIDAAIHLLRVLMHWCDSESLSWDNIKEAATEQYLDDIEKADK